MKTSLTVAVLLLVSCGRGVGAGVVGTARSKDSLYIGSFNLKNLGKTKMANPEVARRIKQIVERYDILHAEEIRDQSEESVYQLLDMLNDGASSKFSVVISEPIGRSTYKEQYAYFYRNQRVRLLDSYKYADTRDVFEREPFNALFAPVTNTSNRFALIGLHAKPADAVLEIGYLKEVIPDVQNRFGANVEFVVLGDLNADCSYATYDKRVAARDYLTTNTNYRWLIGEDADTTVRASTDCAYDRFVVPSSLASRVVSGSAVPFDFGAWLGIIETQSLDVSDHYPVEMKLRM